MRSRVVLYAGLLALAACSAPPGNSLGPSATAEPVADVVVGGARPVTVHVPPGYDPSRPAPLLIVLHGYGSDGNGHDAYFGLGKLAEDRGFLYAAPDGTVDSAGNRFWNATDACCDFDGAGVGDAAYLDEVIADAEATLNVDPKRVYLVGHSNGGFMSYRFACTDAGRVAAIVSLAGATPAQPADCAPAAPVAVLQIHGTADDTIAFDGGTIAGLGSGRQMAAHPGARDTVAMWGRYDGCDDVPVETAERVDVDADIGSPGHPDEASVTRWSGCDPGGAVELWTIPGGGHGPRLSDTLPNAVLDFLAAHPKP